MKMGNHPVGAFYPLTDHLGSTTMTTDANGYEVAEIRYKAWGESRYSWNTTPTKHQYTGPYSNVNDFGLMYYNARWYDSALSRFSSADTIVPQPGSPLDWDRYAYTRNNPINYTDPSGHRPVEGCGDEGKEACTPTQQELAAYAYFIQQNETSLCKGGNMNYCSPIEEEIYNNRPMTGFHLGYSGQGGFGIEGGVYYQKEWVIDWIKGDVYTTKTVGVFGYGGTPTGVSGQVNAGISNIHGIPWWFSQENIIDSLEGQNIDKGVALGVNTVAVLDVGYSKSYDIDINRGYLYNNNGYQMYSTSHDIIFGIDSFPNMVDGSFQMGWSNTFDVTVWSLW